MRGDSIAVYDIILNRLTILGSRGEVGRIISLRGVFDRARQLRSYDDSAFIGLSYSAGAVSEIGRYRVPYSVVHLGPSGSIKDTLAVFGGSEGFRSGTVDGPLPFGKNGHLAIHGRDLVLGTADSLAFDRYRGPGALSQRVRVPGFDLRLSAEQIDSTRQALRPPKDRPAPPDVMQLIESITIPDFRPAYSRLLIDSEGYVWAAHYHTRVNFGQRVNWEVFSPDGEWLGRMGTPAGFTVFEIGPGYVLGVRRDELDVEHVQLLTLFRSDVG
jgi:hypothetical protein